MRAIIKTFLASFLLTASTQAYSANLAPPPNFPLEVAPKPTLKSTPASSISLGSVVVDFDKTTLGEAMKQIKAGRIQHQGDAGESVYWLCYSIRAEDEWEQLWLLSHGEMGGEEHVIYGVAAKILPSKPSAAACPELPAGLRPVKLNNGFWLGMKTDEIRKKLGKPSLESKGWLLYNSEQMFRNDPRAKAWGEHDWAVYGSLDLRVRSGKVVEMWATKQGEGSSSEFEPHPLQNLDPHPLQEYLRRMP